MTLKEQTIKRIEQQKEKIEEHKKEYGRVGLFDKLELKYLESVLKDLEVLEIFRDKINIVLEEDYLSCYGGNSINEDEFEKIKEWLNG